MLETKKLLLVERNKVINIYCYEDSVLKELFLSVDWLSANYPERLKKALDNSETVFTGWDGKQLVGLVNAIDDAELTAYVPYLCVNPSYPGNGIGKCLLDRIKEKYRNYLYIILIECRIRH